MIVDFTKGVALCCSFSGIFLIICVYGKKCFNNAHCSNEYQLISKPNYRCFAKLIAALTNRNVADQTNVHLTKQDQ